MPEKKRSKKAQDVIYLLGLEQTPQPNMLPMFRNAPENGSRIANVGCVGAASTITARKQGTFSHAVAIAATELASLLLFGRVTGMTPIQALGIGCYKNWKTVVEAKTTGPDGSEYTYIVVISEETQNNNPDKEVSVRAVKYETTQECWSDCNLSEESPIPVLIALIFYFQVAHYNHDSLVRESLEEIGDRLKSAMGQGMVVSETDNNTEMEYAHAAAYLTEAIRVFLLDKHHHVIDGGRITPLPLSILESQAGNIEVCVVGSIFDILGSIQSTTCMATENVKEGMYELSPGRKFSEKEQQMMIPLAASTVIPAFAVECAEYAEKLGFRNYLLEGPPGSGKTVASTIIGSLLGLPQVKFICHATTTAENLTGYFAPRTDDEPAENVKLPDLDDMVFDPAGAYEKMTGSRLTQSGATPTAADCKDAMLALLTKQKQASEFVFVKSQLAEAVRNGWLIEIQEVGAIADGATLKLLNQLLDDTQQLELPNGEIISRHPDTVVVFTKNDYDNEMDNSLRDRIQYCRTVDMPAPSEMIARVRAKTGYDNTDNLSVMVKIITEMRDAMKNTDVNYYNRIGMRSLIAWTQMAALTKDFKSACEVTVIQKVSSDPEIQGDLRSIYDQYAAKLH